MSYKKLNIIIGWIVFLIAAIAFLNTIEPTASFWDCGEFIATSYKLEVGHPPGAPLFMMIARVFSLFVNPENVAKMINSMSALCSAFTILFLFWSITYLAKKLVSDKKGLSKGQIVAVLGSGVVGALAYTFSDSFWFSAVEGEVYAMSSLFTALVFWAMLRWDADADKPFANKWIIFIAFLMGLSIGVHLLNLLVIPAMTLIYYFRKSRVTKKGLIKTLILSVVLLAFVQYGIIPGIVILASKFELAFVNGFGLPYNTGVLFYFLLLISLIIWGLWFTSKKRKANLNTAILCFTFILIGYSSFALIVIRSAANTPMDENNPENVFSLLAYLNREQYGDRPLFYGNYFNSPLDNEKPYKDGSPVYYPENGKYVVVDDRKNSIPNYASEFCSFFPRMYSSDSKHVREYKKWSNFKGRPIRYQTISGETKIINKPTFIENWTFFFTYQLGWMYGRYFMWNFAGRQNDIQGHGGILNGNLISGIDFIDNARLGPQENIPSDLKNNKANNKFYFLPLILGLIGLFFQFNRSRKYGIIVFLLFFFTGIAIIIYLNQYPLQPRERDYAYAASFYGFAIWIGLGVLALYEHLKKYMNEVIVAGATASICLAAVPGVMAKDGWDDHDRSNTYTARDFAKNYLDSCAPNAILFTNGDNDTFPLWYVQEVEGYRTDVRVVNLSLLNTDWYINQMRRKAYDSDPVPFKMDPKEYRQGTRDYVPVIDKNKKGIFVDVKKVMQFITDPSQQALFSGSKRMNYFPTKKFSLKVDSAKVITNHTVPIGMESKIVPEIQWKMNKNYILKNDMMILDLLANNDWNRPIYFAITTGTSSYIGLQNYFQLEGLAYRLVPFKVEPKDGQTGYINTDKMYENLMHKFHWGGIDKNQIYLNDNNQRMCMNFRNNFARLADALIRKGETKRALKVLDRCVEVMPESNVPYNFFMLPIAENYYKANAKEKAEYIVLKLADVYDKKLKYYLSLDAELYNQVSREAQQAISVLYRLSMLTNETYPNKDIGAEIKQKFENYQTLFQTKEQQNKALPQ